MEQAASSDNFDDEIHTVLFLRAVYLLLSRALYTCVC